MGTEILLLQMSFQQVMRILNLKEMPAYYCTETQSHNIHILMQKGLLGLLMPSDQDPIMSVNKYIEANTSNQPVDSRINLEQYNRDQSRVHYITVHTRNPRLSPKSQYW
jgi:hypothetical protein